jgi:putative membrane protein insertion efficiency factor
MSGSSMPGRLRPASLAQRVLSAPIHAYRYAVSPLMAPACRFFPSCSEYALEAIARHGVLSGGWLAARRLCRCHPWNPGGLDPVPPSPKSE